MSRRTCATSRADAGAARDRQGTGPDAEDPRAACRSCRRDVDRVRQILTNLVGNAIKFTDAGTVQVGVDVRAGALALQVTDTGIGIPETQLDKIFHEFVQVDQTLARRQGGTGLGLAIARRLARLMGGEVSVTSIAGKGSRFTLTLPRATGAAPERSAPVARRTRAESRTSDGGSDGDRGVPV